MRGRGERDPRLTVIDDGSHLVYQRIVTAEGPEGGPYFVARGGPFLPASDSLDAVYIQAKRWTTTVGRPEVQAFAGSLEGHHARKGVFITTSSFTSDAQKYVSQIEKRIVLIDGRQLVDFMIEHGVGVHVTRRYEVKSLDADYFEEA